MNNTIPGLDLSLNTPVVAAARELLLDEALASLVKTKTAWGHAVRMVLLGTPESRPAPPKLVTATPAVPSNTTGQNATARWLAANASAVYTTLTTHLMTRMQRSGELKVVQDHIQEFLTKLIEDDRLAKVLTVGETPELSVLRVWAYQSACTELRRWGVDATLRATRQAKTSREVKKGAEFKVVQSAVPAREVSSTDDNGEVTSDLYDTNTPSPEDILEAKTSRDARIAHVRKTLLRKGQGHMVPVVEGLMEGRTIEDLVAQYGVTHEAIVRMARNVRAA